MSTGNHKIQFRASREQCIAWGVAATAAGLELHDWIRETLDRGVSGEMKIHTPKARPAPKKSQKKKAPPAQKGLQVVPIDVKPEKERPTGGGDIPPATATLESPFATKQKARKEWDRQYKKVALEIRDSWAEENPRP